MLKWPENRLDKFYPAVLAGMAGTLAGFMQTKNPLALFAVPALLVVLLYPAAVLGFFTGGGLLVLVKMLGLAGEQGFYLNIASFLLPVLGMLFYLLWKGNFFVLSRALAGVECLAATGCAVLLAAGMAGSLYPDYGTEKLRHYLTGNLICFLAPVLAAAVWGKSGLLSFLRGLAAGGLVLLACFWLGGQWPDLPANPYAVLHFNPIGISRLLGVFALACLFVRVPFLLQLLPAAAAFAAMILLGARGPVLALAAALAVWFLLAGRRRIFLLPAAFALLLVLYTCSGFQPVPGLFHTGDTGRLELYRPAVDAFMETPLFGAGTGSFTALAPYPGVFYPHNIFLEMAAELGLAGLAMVLLLIGGSFVRLLRLAAVEDKLPGANSKEADSGPLVNKKAGGAISGFAGALLVYGLVNALVSGDITANFLLWLAAGLVAAAHAVAVEGGGG
jgi:O-antigen ligase